VNPWEREPRVGGGTSPPKGIAPPAARTPPFLQRVPLPWCCRLLLPQQHVASYRKTQTTKMSSDEQRESLYDECGQT
jgi:hypothetical protein